MRTRLTAFAILALFATADLSAQYLTRQQAADALLAPGSGVAIDTVLSAAWCPITDFGFGSGFEGLLDHQSKVDPVQLGSQPFPGPGVIVDSPSYFFWIDDRPTGDFAHDVRFVLVDATIAAPSVGNGGITVSIQGWWPEITPFGQSTTTYFNTQDGQASSFPPATGNPDGLIAGAAAWFTPGPAPPPAPPLAPKLFTAAANNCGLLFNGGEGRFKPYLARREMDYTGHHGVPANRILKVNNGCAGSRADLAAGIDSICNIMPPCDKIYVTISGHGVMNELCFSDGRISEEDFCDTMRKLGSKNVPICMTITNCYGGSMIDQDWGFPDGSVIITAADSTHTSWGGMVITGSGDTIKWEDPETGMKFCENPYTYSLSKCLGDNRADANRDGDVDECEAQMWVLQRMPCYKWPNGKLYYPASASDTGPNISPQKVVIGSSPTSVNLNVCNSTPGTKTDFHLTLTGDATGGTIRAWRSTSNDNVDFSNPWADSTGQRTATYDAATNQTTVNWVDKGDPVAQGDYIHFGYTNSDGLRVVRLDWTQNAAPAEPAAAGGAAATDAPSTQSVDLSIINPAEILGGQGEELTVTVTLRTSPLPIPLDNLNLVDPFVSSLPAQPLGTVTVQPGKRFAFDLPLNAVVPEGHHIVLQMDNAWDLNGHVSMMLFQFEATDSIECPTPDPVSITHIAPTQATIEWSAVEAASGFLIQINELGSPPSILSTGLQAQLLVEPLNPASTYEVQVAALCGFRTSDFTTPIVFSTPCEQPLLTIVPISPNVPGGTDGGADLTVEGGSPPYTYVWSDGTSNEDLSNVAAGVYTVTVAESNGCVAVGSVEITDPQPCIAGGIMTGLVATNITFTRAVLNWDFLAGGFIYQIRGREVGTTSFVVLTLANPIVNSLPVTGLKPGTIYEWEMRAACDPTGSVVTAWSGLVQFTTQPCPVPQNPFANPVFPDFAHLEWDVVPEAVGYRLRGAVLGSTSATTVDLPGAGNNFLDAPGLTPNTTYVWLVRSACDDGTLVFSEETPLQNFTTPDFASKTEMDRLQQDVGMNLYPNPAQQDLAIRLTGMETALVQEVALFDVSGRVFKQDFLLGIDGLHVDVSRLPNGVYQVRVHDGSRHVSRRLVIAR